MVNREGDGRRWAANYIAQKEARRRAGAVARVTAVVLIAVMATLVFTGHRMAPDCVRAFVCFERGH